MDQQIEKIIDWIADDVRENFCGKLIESSLVLTGLWPYQSLVGGRIAFLSIQVMNLSLMVPMISFLVQVWGHDYDIMTENIMFLTMVVTFSILHGWFYNLTPKVASLISVSTRSLRSLAYQDEEKHVLKNIKRGHLVTVAFAAFASIIGFSLSVITLIVDAISLRTNLTESHLIFIRCDYIFFEQNDYYYITLCHFNFVVATILISWTGVLGIIIISSEQIVGFSSLVSYRLQHIVRLRECSERLQRHNDYYIRPRELSYTIDLHNRTSRLRNATEEVFKEAILIFEAISVAVLAMEYYYIFSSNAPVFKKCIVTGDTISLYLCLFFINSMGQRIIDSSENILESIYFCDWYQIQPKERKDLLTIMQRSQEPLYLTANKVAVLSIEAFVKLVKMSNTYFAAFASMSSKTHGASS